MLDLFATYSAYILLLEMKHNIIVMIRLSKIAASGYFMTVFACELVLSYM